MSKYLLIKGNENILYDSAIAIAFHLNVDDSTIGRRFKKSNIEVINGYLIYKITDHIKNYKRGQPGFKHN